MKILIYTFPIIFLLFVAFYGYISFSILVRRKPVIVRSNIVMVLLALLLIPVIIFNVIRLDYSASDNLWQLLAPGSFAFLLVFLFFMLKGFSIYGIDSSDFRRLLLAAFDALGIKIAEELSKIKLIDSNAEVNISFQEWTGTGMIRTKRRKDFDLRKLQKEYSKLLENSDVKTKKVTAFFYLGFSIFMLGFSAFFIWMIINNKV